MNPDTVDEALKRLGSSRILRVAEQARQRNALDPDPMCGEIAKLREELAIMRERIAVLEANAAGKCTTVLTIRNTPPLTPPYVVTAIDTGEE